MLQVKNIIQRAMGSAKEKKIILTPVKNGKEDFIQEGLLQ